MPHTESHLAKQSVAVKGMNCASCAATIQKTLKNSPGVTSCEVNFGNEKAKIEFDPEQTSLAELSKAIEPFGYSLVEQQHPTTPQAGSHDHSQMDHSEHTGIGQSKAEKLAELAAQRRKVLFVMPAAIIIFALMLWEIAAQSLEGFPEFLLPMELFQSLSLILATVVLFWVGREFLREVVIFAKYRVANMYTLIGIGTLVAYVYSTIIVLFPQVRELFNLPEFVYFDVVIVVIGFVYFGKFLETRSKLLTGEAIEKLLNLQAKTALVEREGAEIEIPVEQVVIGELIIVKPGSKIPVDGIIVEGKSAIDESMVTGEAMPVDKGIKDIVIGGTINKQGSFKLEATKVGSETVLSQIIQMVDEAQGSKAPIQGLADRISAVFVPAVLVISLTTLAAWLLIGPMFMPFTEALSLGLLCFTGVLVIACPCALGLATPTAIIVGTGKGAENGILIKDAESLEKLYKANVIVTDKTGTITKGKPEVSDIIPLGNRTEKEVLQILGSLEKRSEHPLAEAIVHRAQESGLDFMTVEDFEILEGKGLKGTIAGTKYFVGNMTLLYELGIDHRSEQVDVLTHHGKTPVLLTTETELLAVIGIADTLKDNARETVDTLHQLGIKVVMLTGDNQNTARYIADLVGIDEVIAEVLP